MIRRLSFLVCAVVLAARVAQAGYPTSLDGYWRFELDPTDAGMQQQWFNRPLRYSIRLPGILQSQNFGNDITTETPWVLSLYDHYWYLREDYKAYTERGKVKVPFLSQPQRHYLGAAWYQRDIEIPRSMFGRRVVLTLERPHWETTVWIDDKKIGSDRSLVASHVYDLGTLSLGRHRLTIRVDNRMLMPYRPDAHSVSDSLGASWNGIVGKIQLEDTGRVWIDDAQVFPNLAQHSMLVKVNIGNVTGHSGQATLTAIWPDIAVVPVTWDENGGKAEIEVPLRIDAEKWDEFHPKKLPLRLWLKGAEVDEYKDLTIGLRDFHAEGNQFVLNGVRINFRGTHSGGDFPLTGYPPTDVKSWLALFETAKKWGLNHMRFHSWCPPEAAFEAADQIGFYLQPEPGMWNEISPGTPMERMLYDETERMIRAYGNHPSFMLLSASNEPKGRWKESLSKWVEYYRKRDPRRLYASGTGHTEREIENITEGTDYLAVQRINQKMLRRESGWFGNDFAESLTDINIPVISHEVGQWVAYPDYDIIKKFKGYLKPGNYEIFRDSMDAHGVVEKNKQFADASGRFQVESYKEEIEANLRTPGMGGFQLLDLHDYLGQGTALVGLLDAFWEPKSYVTADDFKEFCNWTVPLARLPKRVYTTSERFEVDVELAHFGAAPMENTTVVWRIDDEPPLARGEWPMRTYAVGKNIPVGRISVDLTKAGVPGEHRLIVTVGPAALFDPLTGKIRRGTDAIKGTTYFENHWSFFVYPEMVPDEFRGNAECPLSRSRDILVTRSWNDAEKRLARSGKVLFVPNNTDLDWTSPPLDRVPVFWNRQMGPAWSRMLGLFIDLKRDSKSYALAHFPSQSYFDWRWAPIISNVRAVNLDRLPRMLEPVVWAIDDWNRNYKLGVIFECAVGDGKLLVSAIDVSREDDANPVSRQLRYSLLNYMSSDCFQPNVSVSVAEIQSLLFDTRIMSKLGATAKIDGAPAGAAIDGDPNTFVSAGDQKAPMREQVELTITFPSPVAITGVVLMPRQNHREHEGEIKTCVISVSDDGSVWNDLQRGYLVSTFAPQRIEFSRTVSTKYLKLVSLSGFGTDKTTSLAELAVIYAGPKLNSDTSDIEYQRNRSATPDIDEGPATKQSKPLPSPTPVWRFDFGPGAVASGYKQVLPQNLYSRETGFGFEPGPEVMCVNRAGKNPLRDDFCTGDKPFYFSVALPEGNYNVTVTLGDAHADSVTTVNAELRRLMLEKVATKRGKFETRTFTVSVRTPQIAGDGEVKLKEREKTTEIWAWDEKLTLAFNDARPTVCAIEITRANDVPTIYLLGDSTVADQPLEPYNSWGQMLTCFFKPGVAIANHAESGESLRSSLGAKRLDKVLSVMKPGDYLLIQYGHNDEKEKGEGVGPFTTYKSDLKKFVIGARKYGGIPVLITPVQRRTFDEKGRITNSHGDYPEAVRQVAKEENVPLIDLNLMSKVLYETWGPEQSKLAFAPNDYTHHNEYGSYELAKCIVEGIRANKLPITKYLGSLSRGLH